MQVKATSSIGFNEFIALMALMMSLVALSIDAMLPALPEIGMQLKVVDANNNQLIVSSVFLGLAIGQLFYGPISDSFGRKIPVYIGLVLFTLGCLISLNAHNLEVMLVGRFLQGLGVAATRTISMAIVRDQFGGDEMARVMSFIMAVFIIVPAIAPAVGQGILLIANWQMIFVLFIVLSVITLLWFGWRQPETLVLEKRRAFTFSLFKTGLKEVVTHPVAMGYTIAAGFIFTPFIAYLSTSQQVFQEQYQLGELYPLFFAVLALAIGLASFLNGRLVTRYGMIAMATKAIRVMSIVSIGMMGLAYIWNGHPPFWLLMVYFAITLFCVGIMFGNMNALAMEPLGHIAGLGAAVIGSLSSLIAIPFAVFIGKSYNGTITPLIMGFALFSVLAMLTIRWVRLKQMK